MDKKQEKEQKQEKEPNKQTDDQIIEEQINQYDFGKATTLLLHKKEYSKIYFDSSKIYL